MSRNYELLKQVERERGAISFTAAAPAQARRAIPAIVADAARPGIDRELLPEINKLAQRLFTTGGDYSPRVVVFAPVEPTTAPNLVCARTSEVLSAQVRGSVCVVDMSFEHPSIDKYFGVKNGHGMMTGLRQPGPLLKMAHRVPDADLTIVTAGTVGDDWQAALSPDAAKARIAELRSQFDYVLIDAPALSNSEHAIFLGALADGLVMIVEANSTPRELASRVKKNLERANVRVLGAVLNSRTFPIPDSIYSRLR